jgi:hypothetical protein
MFFFEKKNQKAFAHGVRLPEGLSQTSKSFLLLFFKKEDSSFLPRLGREITHLCLIRRRDTVFISDIISPGDFARGEWTG